MSPLEAGPACGPGSRCYLLAGINVAGSEAARELELESAYLPR